MSVLFLDPLVLTLVLAVATEVFLVWRGTFRRWLGRADWWTVLAWPLPLLLLVVPAAVGPVMSGLEWLGLDLGALHAALYAACYAVPLVGLTLAPPRWLLPRWARQRLSVLPPAGDEPGSAPALQAARGHGCLSRWVWSVDAVPGRVRLEDDHLRFWAEGGDAQTGEASRTVPELDDETIAQISLSAEGELHLEPPRGGWWSPHHLDVDLAAVDHWHVRAARPWRRDGLLVLEVEGRRPVRLWVADVRALAADVAEARRIG